MTEMKRMVYVVGKVFDDRPGWEICGIYTDQHDAEEACRDGLYFVGPLVLDTSLPEATMEWPGGYFPKAMEGEGGK